jgi:predicted secreted protein
MGWVSGIVVYILIWWVALFAVLPWGARRAEQPLPGTVESAPDKPMLLRKALATTIVAAVLWGGVEALVLSDLISFHEMAKAINVE